MEKENRFQDYSGYRNKFEKLVKLEREEEMQRHQWEIRNLSPRERERKGRALLGMKGRDQGKGLGNSFIVKLVRGGQLPDTEIAVGDLILVSKGNPLDDQNPSGTVIEKTNYSISAAFNTKPPRWVYGRGLRVDLYVNDITFQRMLEALKSFGKTQPGYLVNILLGKERPRFREAGPFQVRNQELNHYQKQVVGNTLKAQDLFLIHGPPGTGKTTTLIEVIEQHIARGNKILATADSNVAVDNMVDLLIRRGQRVVRAGHPARVTETLRKHTLDYLVENKEQFQKARKLRDKAAQLKQEQEDHAFPAAKWRRGFSDEMIKKLAQRNQGSRGVPAKQIQSMASWIHQQEKINALMDRAKQLEVQAVDELIKGTEVVCTTNSTAGSELLQGRSFDVIIIDEATQATEPSCLIPMAHGRKVIMAGDHKQLPPTILNQEAEREGLSETMFERLLSVHHPGIKGMLHVQYRMNTKIMQFPNQHFYHSELQAAPEVASHQLSIKASGSDLVSQLCSPEKVVAFADTRGKYRERTRPGSTSKENPQEAELVKEVAGRWLKSGVKPVQIGIISPYDDQVDLLNRKIRVPGLEIKTVDGFQGREKDAIILSLVRANQKGEIGFLSDLRRLNVSITRARKKLVMIGDSNTLSHHPTYKQLIDYLSQLGGTWNVD